MLIRNAVGTPSLGLDVLLALCRVLEAVVELHLQRLDHGLLHHDVLVVEDLDDELVVELIVDVDNDGLDRRVALDEDTCEGGGRRARVSGWSRGEGRGGDCEDFPKVVACYLPLMARGMLTVF